MSTILQIFISRIFIAHNLRWKIGYTLRVLTTCASTYTASASASGLALSTTWYAWYVREAWVCLELSMGQVKVNMDIQTASPTTISSDSAAANTRSANAVWPQSPEGDGNMKVTMVKSTTGRPQTRHRDGLLWLPSKVLRCPV